MRRSGLIGSSKRAIDADAATRIDGIDEHRTDAKRRSVLIGSSKGGTDAVRRSAMNGFGKRGGRARYSGLAAFELQRRAVSIALHERY